MWLFNETVLFLVLCCFNTVRGERNDNAGSQPESRPVCTSVGYFPDPEYCDKFYRCVAVPSDHRDGVGTGFRKHDFECAPGTTFDPDSISCTISQGRGHCDQRPPVPVPPPTPASQQCGYSIDVVRINGAPDGVRKSMLTYNGHFPGPVLRCQRGKYLVVRVTNYLNVTTTVHWHGIEQNMSPFYDGPEGVTQCPILPGQSMVYKFQTFQSGTYWYHSHDGQQYTDGAWGILIIDNTPQEVWSNLYDDELIITLNDWQHAPADELLATFLANDQLFPFPDSLLINGIGTYNCTQARLDGYSCRPNPKYPAVVKVVPGKKYRVRVINTAAATRFEFSIDGHRLVVIETDGVDTLLTGPVDQATLWAAQRYSFILNANGSLNEYWIRASGNFGGQGLAVLQYDRSAPVDIESTTVDIEDAIPQGEQSRPAIPDINWDRLTAERKCGKSGGHRSRRSDEYSEDAATRHYAFFEEDSPAASIPTDDRDAGKELRLPTTTAPANPVILDQVNCIPYRTGGQTDAPNYFDQEVVINADFCPGSGPDGTGFLCMNGVQFVPGPKGSKPVLFQFIEGQLLTGTGAQYHTPELNRVIQVRLNNRHPRDHPWHLHGHSFWVMGTGLPEAGDYNPARDESKLTTKTVRRDTTGTWDKSWMVFRYYTNNPGTWFFHCHINWHLGAGFGAVFAEARGIAELVYCDPPKEVVKVCRRSHVNVF